MISARGWVGYVGKAELRPSRVWSSWSIWWPVFAGANAIEARPRVQIDRRLRQYARAAD